MATYWVATTGSDSNPGTSEGSPFLTIQKAHDTITADNGDIINVKAGTYNETVTISKGSTAAVGTLMTVLRGYTTTPGDAQGSATDETNPPVIIDGQSTRANCLVSSGARYGWVIEGIECKNATSHNVSCASLDQSVWRFCRSTDSGSNGFVVGLGTGVYRCIDSGAGGHAFTQWNTVGHHGITFAYCKALNPAWAGFYCFTGFVCYGCVAFSAANQGFRFEDQALGEGIPVIVNCLVDGDGAGTGIYFDNCLGPVVVINNVIYDCTTGIDCLTTDMSPCAVHRNNLLNSNTTDYGTLYDAVDLSGFDFTGTPTFVDEANNDYRPVAGSAVINQGYAYGGTGNFDIGPYEFKGGNRIKITPAAMAGGMS